MISSEKGNEKANLSRSARLDITVDDYTAMLESPLNCIYQFGNTDID